MRKVVHFEIPAEDLDRAKSFYGSVFGWDLTTVPMPGREYTTISTVPVDPATQIPTEPGAINGGMLARQGPIQAPVVTIEVDDIDAALARVQELGGKTVLGRQAVGDMGFSGYFVDPEGNVVGLWQNAV